MKKLVGLMVGSLVVMSAGCAGISESVKGIAGVSTKVLEDSRPQAIAKTFGNDYFTCYTKSADILKRLEVYIYSQDIKKHMIAAYVSQQDTTPVGVFFKEIEKDKTQIEVSSPSAFAKELIANKLFAELGKVL